MTTQVLVQPFSMKNVVATISAVGAAASAVYEFQSALDKVTFTPSASTVSWTGLANNTYTDISTATWVAEIEYAQDWTTSNSLSRYLYDNEGTTKVFTLKPQVASGPTWTVNVIITPGAVGGDVNAIAIATVTLPCTGKPVPSA